MGLMFTFTLLLNFGYFEVAFCTDHIVKPKCSKDAKICEFHFNIGYKETMVYYDSDYMRAHPVVTINNRLYRRTSCNDYLPLTDKELENVTTADGSRKLFFSINGQLPGPPIIVYENQEVVVHVKNNLLSESVTLHWHGLVQRGTPWMDGVAGVSQCPINPDETFTYRFLAKPAGTNWYHSHIGAQRTEGLAGPLIVLENKKREDDGRLPVFADDYIMMLQDWMHQSSDQMYYQHLWNMARFMPGTGYSNTTCYRSTLQADFAHIGVVPFTSGMINGKGQHYPDHGDEPENQALPLETFTVKYGSSYRFRVINAGMIYAFRVSVDEHQIKLISVDGNDVNVQAAESIIIQPGERIDFIVHADVAVRNYWIRADTLEVRTTHRGIISPGKVLGILHYEGSSLSHLPKSNRRKCSRTHRCRVINCPFGYYPKKTYTDCMSIADVKSTNFEIKQHPVPKIKNKNDLQEIFLNFHFASNDKIPFVPSVSGKRFKRPTAPFQTYPKQERFFESCEGKNCIDNCCCTNIIKLKKNKTVQLVLFNQDDTLFDMPHPIHMHGHQFHVLKMAFPGYNSVTGAIESATPDLECDTPYCNYPTWKNKTWDGDKIPGLNLVNPPLKDTVIVPRNGYVVIRIKADNPGYWIMHCHIEIHQVEGMALVFQEGEISEMPPVPDRFHKCGDFDWSSNAFRKFINNDITYSEFIANPSVVPDVSGDDDDGIHNNSSKTNGFSSLEYFLIGTVCVLTIAVTLVFLVVKSKSSSSSISDPQREPLISGQQDLHSQQAITEQETRD